MRAVFDDNLVTGNEMIDGQHKELIEKINRLLDSCENGNDKRVASEEGMCESTSPPFVKKE